jgi:hypothetical protein
MSASIDRIEVRTTEVIIVAVWISCIDPKMPVISVPIYRAIEIQAFEIITVLPVVQYVLQVDIALLPVISVNVAIVVDAHQIVEVDLIGGFVLVICKIQFIRHLIRQEESLLSGLLITHGAC